MRRYNPSVYSGGQISGSGSDQFEDLLLSPESHSSLEGSLLSSGENIKIFHQSQEKPRAPHSETDSVADPMNQPIKKPQPVFKSNACPLEIQMENLNIFIRPDNWIKKLTSRITKSNDKWLHILKDIKGIVKPGEVMAILGSSGSGKTTLLNTLAGRHRHNRAGIRITSANNNTGIDHVYYSPLLNRYLDLERIRSLVGYVMQQDHLLPHLTCYETLKYAGLLRLPNTLSATEKEQIVQNIILELGLRDCAHVRVGTTGGSGQRLSGGERRRLSIAIQLLTQPSVLFLDEPTSGLDSFTANRLMNTILKIAHQQNRTIVCTIHQPRSEILHLFDKVLLLSKGQLVYFGPADTMVSYFADHGYQCPPHVNPADYLLDQISIDPRSDVAYKKTTERLRNLVATFNESDHTKDISVQLLQHKQQMLARKMEAQEGKTTPDVRLPTVKRASLLSTVSILTRRAFLNVFRNPLVIITRMMQVISFGIILSLCYLHIENDQIGIRNMQGFLYECQALLFVGLLNAIAIFPSERDIFYKERADGMYGTLSFFLSYLITEIPFEVVSVIIYAVITYAVIGLHATWESFVLYTVVLFCLTFSGESLGIVLCSLFSGVGIANTLSTIILSLGLLASGFFIPIVELPFVIRYIDYTLISTFITQVLAINQFEDETYTCTEDQEIHNQCPITTGEQVLSSMKIEASYLYPSFVIAIFLALLYRLLAYLVLRFKRIKQVL